jgi:class 3 adenylate cyclase/tetratricopeptide (TPR) repeat protein
MTMRCTKCEAENREGRKFCAKCGSPLARRCPQCSASNEPSEDFCGECGAALVTTQTRTVQSPTAAAVTGSDILITPERADGSSALDGERKTVTALFADIKGSMELIEDLDPEEARAIVDPALKLMIDAVHRYEGYVAQSTGDGIFALFGAPVAHEDHPQRALHAARRMQEDLKRYADRLRERGQPPLSVRVGVNSGEVVVRSIQTGDAHTEYTPIGHSISLAARLETLAAPGSVVIGESVQKFVEGYFQLKALGASRIKGVSERVKVYEVIGLGALRTRLQRSAGRGLTKFVEREREMDALKHSGERAKSGHGQIVAAMAEPGVGKSRLFYEFKVTSQAGWMVLETFSVSHGKASAYLPVIDLLHGYFEIATEDDGRRRRQKILGKLLELDRALEDTVPYLYALLGIVEGEDPLAQLDPQIKRRHTFEAIKRLLLRESLNQPLMLIFEDLHWIDEETQSLLNLLADSIASAKILLLINYRPEYSHQWGGKTYYTQLRLDPLGREGGEEMLSALLGNGADLFALKRLIIERTEGNPFFMEETVQALFEEGALVRNGSVLKITRSLGDLKIPATVQAILAARIDRLPQDEKDLLQTLAVLGREFALSLIRLVARITDDDLNRMLGKLQLAEFIYEQPATGDIEYVFKHALTQEVAYSSLLIERRKALHERAGAAMESLFTQRIDDYVAELAHHYDRGGNVRKAVEYIGRAGARAAAQVAHMEAVGYLTRAVELMRRLPDDAERARQELELQMALSASLHIAKGVGVPERETALLRAKELCEQVGNSMRLIEVLLGLSVLRVSRDELSAAHKLAQGAFALAEQAKEPRMLGAAHTVMALSLYAEGQFAAARDHFESAIELFDLGTVGTLGQIAAAGQSAEALLAHVLVILGYPGTALVRQRAALAAARRRGTPFGAAIALSLCAIRAAELRDAATVKVYVEELVSVTTEHVIPTYRGIAIFYRGWVIAAGGQTTEGIDEMRRALSELGLTLLRAPMTVAFAEVCGRSGLANEGLTIVQEELALPHRIAHAEFHRLRGELMLIKDPSDEHQAERSFREAIEIAREQAARLYELRATTSLARLLASQGRRDEARAMLAEIYNWFTEGFDTADLKEAKALLDQLNP